jgi:NTE family protein
MGENREEHARPASGIALALSGGAARAIAHIGVLKVLVETGIPICGIAGTSGGAMIGALFAAGYPIVDLERDALGIEWRRLAELRPHPLGILSTRRLGEFLERRIGDLHFRELKIPAAVVATNLTSGERHIFDRGRVVPAVEASCAVPEFYRPVELDDQVFVDGGVVDPLPIETARAITGRPVIGVSVLQRRPHEGGPRRAWHLVGQICETVQYELVRRSVPAADLFVEPEIGAYPYFALENATGLMAAGEKAMREQLDRLRSMLRGAGD